MCDNENETSFSFPLVLVVHDVLDDCNTDVSNDCPLILKKYLTKSVLISIFSEWSVLISNHQSDIMSLFEAILRWRNVVNGCVTNPNPNPTLNLDRIN